MPMKNPPASNATNTQKRICTSSGGSVTPTLGNCGNSNSTTAASRNVMHPKGRGSPGRGSGDSPRSLRTGSLNVRLAAAAAYQFAQAGVEVTRISLGDFPLPIYDGDLETSKGIPENALKLARHIVRSQPDARVLTVNLELCTLHLRETAVFCQMFTGRINLPLALLTVSEGTIYGRFGFGPATRLRHVEVDVQHRFALHISIGQAF